MSAHRWLLRLSETCSPCGSMLSPGTCNLASAGHPSRYTSHSSVVHAGARWTVASGFRARRRDKYSPAPRSYSPHLCAIPHWERQTQSAPSSPTQEPATGSNQRECCRVRRSFVRRNRKKFDYFLQCLSVRLSVITIGLKNKPRKNLQGNSCLSRNWAMGGER